MLEKLEGSHCDPVPITFLEELEEGCTLLFATTNIFSLLHCLPTPYNQDRPYNQDGQFGTDIVLGTALLALEQELEPESGFHYRCFIGELLPLCRTKSILFY